MGRFSFYRRRVGAPGQQRVNPGIGGSIGAFGKSLTALGERLDARQDRLDKMNASTKAMEAVTRLTESRANLKHQKYGDEDYEETWRGVSSDIVGTYDDAFANDRERGYFEQSMGKSMAKFEREVGIEGIAGRGEKAAVKMKDSINGAESAARASGDFAMGLELASSVRDAVMASGMSAKEKEKFALQGERSVMDNNADGMVSTGLSKDPPLAVVELMKKNLTDKWRPKMTDEKYDELMNRLENYGRTKKKGQEKVSRKNLDEAYYHATRRGDPSYFFKVYNRDFPSLSDPNKEEARDMRYALTEMVPTLKRISGGKESVKDIGRLLSRGEEEKMVSAHPPNRAFGIRRVFSTLREQNKELQAAYKKDPAETLANMNEAVMRAQSAFFSEGGQTPERFKQMKAVIDAQRDTSFPGEKVSYFPQKHFDGTKTLVERAKGKGVDSGAFKDLKSHIRGLARSVGPDNVPYLMDDMERAGLQGESLFAMKLVAVNSPLANVALEASLMDDKAFKDDPIYKEKLKTAYEHVDSILPAWAGSSTNIKEIVRPVVADALAKTVVMSGRSRVTGEVTVEDVMDQLGFGEANVHRGGTFGDTPLGQYFSEVFGGRKDSKEVVIFNNPRAKEEFPAFQSSIQTMLGTSGALDHLVPSTIKGMGARSKYMEEAVKNLRFVNDGGGELKLIDNQGRSISRKDGQKIKVSEEQIIQFMQDQKALERSESQLINDLFDKTIGETAGTISTKALRFLRERSTVKWTAKTMSQFGEIFKKKHLSKAQKAKIRALREEQAKVYDPIRTQLGLPTYGKALERTEAIVGAGGVPLE